MEQEVKFTDFDAPLEMDYRPLSRAALVTLPIGLLSLLALLTPVFWFLPLISALAAALAVRSITRSEMKVTGRALALSMLVVSLVLLGFAPARYLAVRSFASTQARTYADAWLELLVSQRLFQAHQLTLPVHERQPPGSDLTEHYREKMLAEGMQRRAMLDVPDPYNDLKQFCEAEPVQQMLAAGKELTATYRSSYVASGREVKPVTLVELTYDMSLSGGDVLTVVIALERELDHNSGQAHWRVRDVAKAR